MHPVTPARSTRRSRLHARSSLLAAPSRPPSSVVCPPVRRSSARRRARRNLTSGYNCALGEGISRDPIDEQGGMNLYGFLQNAGLNRVDIDGEIGLDTALDLLVLGVDLSTGAGLATIALDVAALAIPLAPNPRGGVVIFRLIKGERRSFELVDHALLREVTEEPGFRGIVWNDLAWRPQQASIVLEYRGRMRNQAGNVYPKHFEFFAKTDAEAKAASFRDSFFAPGVDDRQVRTMIDEALRQHRVSFGQTLFKQLDGYVYNAGLPFGRANSLRLNVGYDRGQCTTKIKLKVGKDGSIHAHPTIDPATPSGSVISNTH